MKVTLHSDSRPQSDEDETNKLCDQYIVVKLEDDAETEQELSIFAPVESSGCEDEEEEEEEVFTWSRRNIRERENQDDSAFPEKKISRRISDGDHKSRQTFLAEQRQRLSVECSATDVSSSNDHLFQKDMNAHLPSEEHTFYQAAPPSDSARGPAEMSGLNMAISPLVAMEPPVFPNAPVQSKSVVGDDQQNILLEVLNYCRFLHAAVQRLEQKIDIQMSNESSYKRSSTRLKSSSKASLPVEERQLSWSLAQHLDSPVQRNPRWVPPWKRGPDSTDLQQADNNILQTGRPPGAGRGRGRGRGRGKGRGRGRGHGGRGHNNRSPAFMLKPFGDETTHDLLPSQIMGSTLLNTVSKHQQKGKKGLTQVDGEKDELEKMPKNDEPTHQDVYHKVLIGSPLRKVWIPLSVYKEAFKEAEPQKAVESVLHALFPISTLSCSAVTGNPAYGIKQLDPNKIEALREFLAEMYPQFDVGVRGATWAQCLGVINNITKNLKKRTEKTSHLPKEVRFSDTPASSQLGIILPT